MLETIGRINVLQKQIRVYFVTARFAMKKVFQILSALNECLFNCPVSCICSVCMNMMWPCIALSIGIIKLNDRSILVFALQGQTVAYRSYSSAR